MRSITRRYTKKQMRRKKILKELWSFLKLFFFVLCIVLAIQAIPVVLGLSPYYQGLYEMAPSFDKVEILKRGLAVKNGHSFVTFGSYQAEMKGDTIIEETYDDEEDKNECERLLKEWGFVGE